MLLLANSAWARLSHGAVDDARLETIAGWMAQDHVGAGILHYDRDYDLLAQHTELAFTSEWLAPHGSL